MAVFTVNTPSLRSLKNAIKDQLPTVTSSHVSEALAYALGFKTNISLINRLRGLPAGWTTTLGEERLFTRLRQLGYVEELPAISFDVLIPNAGMPAQFADWLAQIATVQKRSGIDAYAVYALRDKCKAAFAEYWNLGRPDPISDDSGSVLRLERGVDHSACQPGWGKLVRSLGLEMRLPGTDHTVRFYERLPLSDGRYVEYSTALVSMPYLAAADNIQQLPKAESIAEMLGWECHVLPQWTWYVPYSKVPSEDATTLVLYRRKENLEDTRRAWAISFKRWVIENRHRLENSGSSLRYAAMGEVIESPHFPLNVEAFDELRTRYLDEFSATGYQWQEGVITRGMEELFAVWTSEREQ